MRKKKNNKKVLYFHLPFIIAKISIKNNKKNKKNVVDNNFININN